MSARTWPVGGDAEARFARVAPWVVALIAVIVYANSVSNGFVLDDNGVIERNDLVHHLSGVWRAFVTPYWPNGAGQYRPLVIASFSAEWSLWHGNPAGFHALNVAWHALASALVFVFARRWLSLGGATIAAVAFAVHPVHVEAVANIVGRAELMAASGVLAMLLLHERRSPWAIAAFGFALFSKEHAIVAPALALGLDLARGTVLFRAVPGDAKRERRALFAMYGGYVVVTVVWGAALVALFHDHQFAAVDPLWETLGAPARWLTMLGVVPVWIRLWFFPLDLTPDYTPRVIEAWPQNAAFAALGAVLLLVSIVLAALLVRRSWSGTIAILWIVVTMGPIANVIVPTGVVAAERTLYLSSVGIVMLLGLGAEWVGVRRYGVAIALSAAVVVAGALRTWTRSPVWKSNQSLFVTTARQHPFGSWTHVALARVYAGHGGYADASAEYRKALSLFDGRRVVWAEAIQSASRAGMIQLADSLVTIAEQRWPADYEIMLAHGSFAVNASRFDEGLGVARRLTSLAPDSAPAWLLQGFAWAASGHADSARAAFSRIPEKHPARLSADSLLDVIGRN